MEHAKHNLEIEPLRLKRIDYVEPTSGAQAKNQQQCTSMRSRRNQEVFLQHEIVAVRDRKDFRVKQTGTKEKV